VTRTRNSKLALPAAVVALVACSSDGSKSDRQSTVAATTAVSVGATTTPTSSSTAADTSGRPAVQKIIDVGGGQLLGMAASEDAIWAISFDNGALVKIDPVTNDVATSVRISQAGSVLSNDGDVWVARYGFGTSGGGIDRVDASSAAKVASIAAGDVCCDLTFGDDLLWLLDAQGTLRSIGRSIRSPPPFREWYPVEKCRITSTRTTWRAIGGASLRPSRLTPSFNTRLSSSSVILPMPLVGCDEMLAALTLPNGPENSAPPLPYQFL